MKTTADLLLLHPPSVFRFREQPTFYGPVSDVVPSSSIFEIFPIGFLTLSSYLEQHGVSVRIVNLALRMLKDSSFDPERFIAGLRPAAFGIDLHWLPHVDGALSLAEMIKRHHPDIPVIFGGLSATYYHAEIMHDYPFVDFILCGDSTEEPLRLLMMAIKRGEGFESVPNLVWRDPRGGMVENPAFFSPDNLDYLKFDYGLLLRKAVKYGDLAGTLPYGGWMSHPVTAVFTCRGCYHDCASCGGSLSGFQRTCQRERPCFRSPERLADDLRQIASLTGAPIMVIGDLLQAGEEYAARFLFSLKKHRIRNELAIEFFRPPPTEFIAMVADAVPRFNVELSPESHDQRVRSAFGRIYDNQELERALEASLYHGCKRVDLFFMVGLPEQDIASVLATVDYCDELLTRYGGDGRVLPMLAPLAPFIDPGSRIFEEPERFGYRLFYRTLQEHRQAMLMPSWKQTLNYETDWMSRDDIVAATYAGARRLVEVKISHALLDQKRGGRLLAQIDRSEALIRRLDATPLLNEDVKREIAAVNRGATLCDKRELDWPIIGWRFKLLNAAKMLFRSLFR